MGARLKDYEGSSVSPVYARARVTAISRTGFVILRCEGWIPTRRTHRHCRLGCFRRPLRYPDTTPDAATDYQSGANQR